MPSLCFKVKSLAAAIDAEMVRETRPAVGSAVLVFDYPTLTRYTVQRYAPLQDRVLAMDGFEPEILWIERDEILAQSARAGLSVGIDPAADFLARLEGIGRLARTYITHKRHLIMCHADFDALCDGSGLSIDLQTVDILAFRGTPLTVGSEGAEWNASTAFEGFNDDLSVLYVTLPGGTPFVMDPVLLDIAKQVVAGERDEDDAVSAISHHARMRDRAVTPELLKGVRNAVQLAIEGIMPPYETAQDLVKLLTYSRTSETVTEIPSLVEAGAAPARHRLRQ